MTTLNPEVAKFARLFMVFVESVRETFKGENLWSYVVTPTDGLDRVSLQKGWDKAAQVWPAIESPDNYFVTMYTLLEHLRQGKKKEKWLSLGAGPALYEIWLSQMVGIHFHVTDFSPEMIELSKKIMKGTKALGISQKTAGKIIHFVMPMEKLEFSDNSFDQILSINALQWVPEWRQAIKEIRRVIKTTGLGNLYLVANTKAIRIKSPDGTENNISDLNTESIFDELEKNQFDLIFSRTMLVRDGQLGAMASRNFIHAQLNLKGFKSWRERDSKATLTAISEEQLGQSKL
jgi:ubiquinone/menaquinone biosynthesis C-methylase UbiE